MAGPRREQLTPVLMHPRERSAMRALPGEWWVSGGHGIELRQIEAPE